MAPENFEVAVVESISTGGGGLTPVMVKVGLLAVSGAGIGMDEGLNLIEALDEAEFLDSKAMAGQDAIAK